jgi:hypothetical protein
LRREISLGLPWLDSFGNFPQTKWTIQVPLRRFDPPNALEFLKACIKSMEIDNLDAIEIGNEVDTYGKDYTIEDYVKQWNAFVDRIEKNVAIPKEPIFQGLTLASAAATRGWTV